jgi:hypothetical protein
MKFLGGFQGLEPEQVAPTLERYSRYLESIRDKLPQGAREFLDEVDNYDLDDPRRLFSSDVEDVMLIEKTVGESGRLDIVVRLEGAWGNRRITIEYFDVTGYCLDCQKKKNVGEIWDRRHEVIGYEISMTEDGKVVHEYEFLFGGSWYIECATLRHSTEVTMLP